MKKPTRREILKLGAGAVLGLGAQELLAGCSHALVRPAGPPALCAGVPAAARSRVAAVRGTDLRAMTFEALEAIGGIGKVVHEGETVFIKPNMVTLPWAGAGYDPFGAGECTKPEIVAAAAEACLQAGASAVTVGDGSQMPSFSWAGARTLDGATDLAREAARLSAKYGRPVKLACLDTETPSWIEVPTGISLGKVAVSSLVLKADRVISIPVAKTHKWSYCTLSIKNFIGTAPLGRYGWVSPSGVNTRVDLHRNDARPRGFGRLSVDLALAAHPDLAIIDFSIGMERDGPSLSVGGAPIDVRRRLGSWLLLASTDLVAADATAARIMGQETPYVDEILSMAVEAGMGSPCEQSIEILGERLDALRMEWAPARVGQAMLFR